MMLYAHCSYGKRHHRSTLPFADVEERQEQDKVTYDTGTPKRPDLASQAKVALGSWLPPRSFPPLAGGCLSSDQNSNANGANDASMSKKSPMEPGVSCLACAFPLGCGLGATVGKSVRVPGE